MSIDVENYIMRNVFNRTQLLRSQLKQITGQYKPLFPEYNEQWQL